jgi:hypothetical protein
MGLFLAADSGRELVRQALRISNAQADEINEFLMELCNQSLGAIKSTMRLGGSQFTMSVPRAKFIPLPDEWAAQFTVTRAIRVTGGRSVRMRAVIGLRASTSRDVEVSDLRENMVLTQDVTDEGGVLLAVAGTRLTANMIVRLKAQAPGRKACITA